MSFLKDLKEKALKEKALKEKVKKIEVKEPTTPTKVKPKKIEIIETIEEETTLLDSLNNSAKLNFLKFSYALLTGNSTTNKRKKSMKQAVIKKLKEF